jgi:DNA-binding response OmpR family regulator
MRPEWKSCPYCGAAPRPLAPVEAAPPASAAAPPTAPRAAVAGNGASRSAPEEPGEITVPRILVVDDDPELRALVRLTLRNGSLPVEIDEAGNGFEALGKIALEKPHLVILDLMMPGKDGFEICKHLREDIRTALIPIVMLTAREDADARLHGFMAGTDDYVVKPFDRAELSARVQRLLERTYRLRRPSLATASELEIV